MQELKKMIIAAGHDSNLGRAVAMSAGYFAKEEKRNPKKSYTVQEMKDFMEFLFDVRTRELSAETEAAIRMIMGSEKMDFGKDEKCSAQQK